MAGRIPNPTALEIAMGNPTKRPINGEEPAFRPKAPSMPKIVADNEIARSEWKRLVPLMLRAGVLTEADGIGLANICMNMALLEECYAKLAEIKAEKKSTLVLADGNDRLERTHPIRALIQQTWKELQCSQREYGLTAAARSRIHVGEGIAAERNQESLEAKLRKPKQLMTVA